MKQYFSNQLADGQSIEDEVFALQEFAQHKDKNGNPYYSVLLQDKTGDLKGRIWSDAISMCKIGKINIGDVLEITGTVSTYQGKQQLTIRRCNITDDYQLEDLIQVTEKGIDTLFARISEHIAGMEDRYLKELFDNMFADEEFSLQFKESPAAEKLHHDFIGGLMEHIVELLDGAEGFLSMYPEANADLVKAGLVLHDIGKIRELKRIGTTFVRTTEGKLIGHLVMSIEMVRKYLPVDFPKELWMNLWHIMLSHHGKLEYGSPVIPKTIEASIVHSLDMMSSQVRLFSRELMMAEEGKEFSDKVWALGTDVYLKRYKSVSNGSAPEKEHLSDEEEMSQGDKGNRVEISQIDLLEDAIEVEEINEEPRASQNDNTLFSKIDPESDPDQVALI